MLIFLVEDGSDHSIRVENPDLPYNYNDKIALVCLLTVAAANATIMSLV